MNKRLSVYLFCALCALVAFPQQRPTLEQLGSIYYAYPTPEGTQTPPPAGYVPFYISHYGRHGSRWMTDDSRYQVVVQLFDSLYNCAELTDLGKDVRLRLHRVWEDARGCSGNITPLGERQHHDIATRMYLHYPQVFRDSAVVDARSSTSLRCAMSMSYFTEALKELNLSLRVSRRAYAKYMDYIAYTSPEGNAFCSEEAEWRKEFREFEARMVRPERLLRSLFLRPETFDAGQADALARNLYWLAADMQNVELTDVSFYDIFEYEELEGIWKTVNARMYVCNAAAPINEGVMPQCAIPLLRNMVDSADRAIRGDESTAAHLRFGHDTHLIRLLALMQVEGCAGAETDMEKFHLAWQDYRISPMGANLQWIFFRNADGDVLVKFLLNENEVRLPIEGVSGVYYRWNEVRNFFSEKLHQ